MAARLYQQFQGSLEKRVVVLYANIPIGATGAVGTLDSAKNQGIKSVTRSSAGKYVITFGISSPAQTDNYQRVLSVTPQILLSTVSATVTGFQVMVDSASTGSVTIQAVGPTDASTTTPIAVDPDDGAILLVEIVLKN
jgi:hypothetical protein